MSETNTYTIILLHGFCQATHLPYVSLRRPLPHMVENCAQTGQQSCTFAVNEGPPGSVEFNVCDRAMLPCTHSQLGHSSS